MMLLWVSLALAGADWDTLLAEGGWEPVATPSTKETGQIDLRTKVIGGNPCLLGIARVDAPIDKLYEVITDVPSAKVWSSETLLASQVLGTSGDKVTYYQHLDVPNWTMAADRYWILDGYPAHEGDVTAFRWERVPWRERFPELAKKLDTEHEKAVEPDPNFGSWSFKQVDGGLTEARYYICSNPGGSLPEWLQKAAATKTLPGTMGDVVREAKRRAGK